VARLLYLFHIAGLLTAAPGTPPAPGQQQPADVIQLVDRAIAAAGGEKALAEATVLKWNANATIHTPRGPLQIEGRWILEPPDRAVVHTWEPGKAESTTRRMLIDVDGGWMERGGGERTPMPTAMLANERDQFYLYSVMRLLPLRGPEVELSVNGPGHVLVRHARRPDVEALFDESGRLARLRTHVSHPADNSDILQEVTFEGSISAAGVRWPRTLRISQDGKPFFEMQLTEFSLATRAEMTAALSREQHAGRYFFSIFRSTSPSFLISSP
jgi:hypothetical protein